MLRTDLSRRVAGGSSPGHTGHTGRIGRIGHIGHTGHSARSPDAPAAAQPACSTPWAVQLLVCGALSLTAVAARAGTDRLPREVEAALRQAQVPREALSVWVQDVGATRTLLAWQPDLGVNPASLMKLLTTYAALDLLGPAWSWSTPVWLQGSVRQGVLDGNVVIKGSGDPKLVPERQWLMWRRVQQLGVREIRGDIVLDRSAFSAPTQDPAEFDGEVLRPYNVRPDALLLNYKSMTLTFTPDAARGVATVGLDAPLDGVSVDAIVPLSAGPCNDWRSAVKADFSAPSRVVFAGSYPAACGEKQWPVAFPEPGRYNERALAGLWRDMGGKLGGTVRDGTAPASPPTFELTSPTLAEVIRDINKYSNNVMAQQLFLTLGLTLRGSGSPDAAREVLKRWLAERCEPACADVVIDNGSGLSREGRISSRVLGQLLQSPWASPVMPEFVASLPVSGTDGTLKRSRAAAGRAHLKTGSLRDAVGVAGYVLAPSGQRRVLVAIINHPNANAARPALDALINWAGSPADR